MRHARKDYNRIQDPDGLIPEDEPVFLIRAQDVCGPQAVELYSDIAEHEGSYQIANRAREWAEEMRRWQAANHRIVKAPDMPAGA